MNVRLPHGNETVPVDIPDNWINGRCYRPFRVEPAKDPIAELHGALNEPVSEQSLRAHSRTHKNAIIVVDSGFPSLFKGVVQALVEEIVDASGMKPEDVRILLTNNVWNGIPQTALERLVPADLRNRHLVELHDPLDDSVNVRLGDLRPGVPLALNRAYAQADLRVLLGPIHPDLLHGFHGGRSLLMPGIAHASMIEALYTADNVSHRAVSYGNVRDNPFHLAGMETLMAARADFLVVPLVASDGSLGDFIAGDPAQAFMAAVAKLREKMTVSVKEPMDIVVTTGGGSPWDSTVYQVMNALSAAEPILKPDGTIIVSAAMDKGFGPAPLQDLIISSESIRGFESQFGDNDRFILGHWVVRRYLQLVDKHEVLVYSKGMSAEEIWNAGMTPIDDLDKAVELAMMNHGQRCKICALPEGPFSLPQLV